MAPWLQQNMETQNAKFKGKELDGEAKGPASQSSNQDMLDMFSNPSSTDTEYDRSSH